MTTTAMRTRRARYRNLENAQQYGVYTFEASYSYDYYGCIFLSHGCTVYPHIEIKSGIRVDV